MIDYSKVAKDINRIKEIDAEIKMINQIAEQCSDGLTMNVALSVKVKTKKEKAACSPITNDDYGSVFGGFTIHFGGSIDYDGDKRNKNNVDIQVRDSASLELLAILVRDRQAERDKLTQKLGKFMAKHTKREVR